MARRSKNEPVRAGDRHAAASVAGRGRPSRHHAGVGRVTAEVKGPALVGTDRVAPGVTRGETHDVGPPFIAAARRCHVF